MADLDHLLPAIAAGDPHAFGQWVAGAEPPLRRALGRFARQVDVEAVLQETLLAVWQVAPRFQPDGRPDALLRMAFRIGRNRAISELRRARVDPVQVDTLERLSAADAVTPAMPDPMLRKQIHRCREELPERPARALALRLQARGGQPDAALADAAGMKLNTFLQNIRRARLALADCLARHGIQLDGGAP